MFKILTDTRKLKRQKDKQIMLAQEKLSRMPDEEIAHMEGNMAERLCRELDLERRGWDDQFRSRLLTFKHKLLAIKIK
jgi:hypothetical protein